MSPSSTEERYPYPALLINTSIVPNLSCACFTAALILSFLVISRATPKAVFGYWSTRSAILLVSRAVTTALSPFFNTALAMPRPIPLEHPVINHVFILSPPSCIYLFYIYSIELRVNYKSI